jgi:hypothetical protein
MSVEWKGWSGIAFTPADFITYVASLRFGAWRPSFVVCHNTERPTLARWHETGGKRQMDALEHYYRDEQKWSAGPHLFVDDAVIWVGTPLTVPGVHSPSWNGISWGVEVVGDYDRERWLPAIAQNLASALATLHDAIGLDAQTIRWHKEDPRTTHKGCPGLNFIDKTDLIAMIRAKLTTRHGHSGEHLPNRVIAA